MNDAGGRSQSNAHLAAVVEFSRDAIIGTDLRGIVTSWNAGAAGMFGYSAVEMIGAAVGRLVPDDRKDEEAEILSRLGRGERVEILETLRKTKGGRLIDVSVSVSPIRSPDGQIVGASKIARDITPLKEREREIMRLSRLYAALSQVNQAIVWTTDREELFRRACQALVEHGGFGMAWIGWREQGTDRLLPVAAVGDEGAYLEKIQITVDERPEGMGPSDSAFRLARPYICNDLLSDPATLPWRAEVLRRGFLSSAAFPIREGGTVAGVLTVYSDKRDFFQDKEVGLLTEAAVDLSFALDNLAREGARRRAEETVRSEKQFSDMMIESMPGIMYFYDSGGRFLRWNRNFETASGYSGEEMARMHPLDFFSEGDKGLLESRIGEVFEKGVSSVEAPFVTKSGKAVPYFFTGHRVDYAGKPCLVGVGIDVSQRKHAEARLAESERKYRELVEHANSIILRWSAGGKVLFLNEFGQRFFGYSADEIVGRHVVGTLVPPDERDGRSLSELMQEICEAPESFAENVNENMRRNGERVWISWTNKVVRDDLGQVIELLSVGTDITERIRAEEARQKSEARYRKLFECAPDGILIADHQSRYIDANASICRMLGYTHDELVGLGAADIVDPAEVPEIEPALGAIGGAGDHHREWQFRRKDGSIFSAEVIATTMPDGNLLGMVRDISERKLAEAEREKRHHAEAADQIKSAFLATMSHELRTPLNSIIGFTGVMLQGLTGNLNPEQKKQLDMVRNSARHLLALVNDVLDISKIEAGQFEVARLPFDLDRSIAKVLALVKPQAEAKGLILREERTRELGQMTGDERRVEQILLNLLSNAIKFTEQGSITVAAERLGAFKLPGATRETPAIRLGVSDTGAGIRPEDMPNLFQPFRQVDSGLSRKHEGTGLGLAICRRLAELMGGDISVRSEWRKGSTFTVTLPLGAREIA